MKPILADMFVANYSVYGARKLWHAARRAGHDIGRDQVARLMRDLDIGGATRRWRRVRTTVADDAGARSPDLVDRKFTAESPNQLWVTDLTYVPTWSGVAYATFVVDVYSRMIVGWSVASHMRTDTVLDALNMAAWNRATDLDGLVTHSDAGSQGSSHRSAGPTVSPRSERNHQSDLSAIPTTTRSRRPSTATTSPS
jgi:putative transposase